MKKLYFITFILLVFSTIIFSSNYINHDLKVKILNPENGYMEVIDKISFPDKYLNRDIHFLLNKNLKIYGSNITLKTIKGELKSEFFGINTAEFKINEKVGVNHYVFKLKNKEIIIKYKGLIVNSFNKSEEYQRGFSENLGIISKKGIYLAGATFWVPWFNENLVTFKITYELPKLWDAVSQGKYNELKNNNKLIRSWESKYPMDEIYFIGARFYKFKKRIGEVNILAYLRSNDKNLATKYLETTEQYLKMYNKLIAPYPYSKFALIENFWETGYGMPSFTLLGPKVIRFPFILHSSYPHELLHNWWGNSVFVNYQKGNWCEGSTVYMADHLIKEQRGEGYLYRRDTLKAYTDNVNSENEFPLKKFRARYNASSSAIGYGKSMMLFHQLRVIFGDKLFKKSMRDFYINNKFRKVGFEEIRKSFEKITKKDLSWFFYQWVELKGAPILRLKDVKLIEDNKRYKLSFYINQESNYVYKLYIPIFVYFSENKLPERMLVILDKKAKNFSFVFNKKPLRLAVDENFDVFRRLDNSEVPITLSTLFGKKRFIVVIPNNSNDKALYEKLYNKLIKMRKQKIDIKYDNELKELPKNLSILLLGKDNKFFDKIKSDLKDNNFKINRNGLKYKNKSYDFSNNSVFFVIKNKDNQKNPIGFLSINNKVIMDSILNKVFHYGKYSYISFDKSANNNLKGIWKVKNSPLIFNFTNKNLNFKRYIRKPLAQTGSGFSIKRMIEHVKYLSSKELKGRELGSKELDIASKYIETKFKDYGLKPGGDNGYFQEWVQDVGRGKGKVRIRNVIGYIEGSNNEFKNESIVVCAHYDHLGLGWPDVREGNKGKIHPGADDNASGISVMLELSRYFSKNFNPERRIIFIAFSGEEAGLLGSKYFVKNYKKFNVKRIIAAINLDTVGRLFNKKPMILGSNSAKEWKFIFMGIGFTTGIKSDLVMQELDSSDQKSFINASIPAIQIFSGPHLDYHRPTDTIDKLDFKGMEKIALIAKEAIIYLSSRKNPLKFTGKTITKKEINKKIMKKKGIKLGIMPDFSYNGKGVRIGMVIKNGLAYKNHLLKGDVIIEINGKSINNLKEYTITMRNIKGRELRIKYLRNNKENILKLLIN